jgi:hypothetical protein
VGSALVDKFGCRKMTILGGVISGLGFIISSFADSIEMVFFTFGFLSGLGLCLCYVTAVVSIAYWFDKKRTLATGLGACGTGIGTFLYAPMTQYSIEEYGWRGTVLLLAGTFFNFCVCGALMRDPDWLIAEQKKPPATAAAAVASKPWTDTEESIVDHCPVVAVENETHADPKESELAVSEPDVAMLYPDVGQYRRMVKEAQGAEYRLTGVTTTVRRPNASTREPNTNPNHNNNSNSNNNGFRSVINLPTYVKHNEKVSGFACAHHTLKPSLHYLGLSPNGHCSIPMKLWRGHKNPLLIRPRFPLKFTMSFSRDRKTPSKMLSINRKTHCEIHKMPLTKTSRRNNKRNTRQ